MKGNMQQKNIKLCLSHRLQPHNRKKGVKHTKEMILNPPAWKMFSVPHVQFFTSASVADVFEINRQVLHNLTSKSLLAFNTGNKKAQIS